MCADKRLVYTPELVNLSEFDGVKFPVEAPGKPTSLIGKIKEALNNFKDSIMGALKLAGKFLLDVARGALEFGKFAVNFVKGVAGKVIKTAGWAVDKALNFGKAVLDSFADRAQQLAAFAFGRRNNAEAVRAQREAEALEFRRSHLIYTTNLYDSLSSLIGYGLWEFKTYTRTGGTAVAPWNIIGKVGQGETKYITQDGSNALRVHKNGVWQFGLHMTVIKDYSQLNTTEKAARLGTKAINGHIDFVIYKGEKKEGNEYHSTRYEFSFPPEKGSKTIDGFIQIPLVDTDTIYYTVELNPVGKYFSLPPGGNKNTISAYMIDVTSIENRLKTLESSVEELKKGFGTEDTQQIDRMVNKAHDKAQTAITVATDEIPEIDLTINIENQLPEIRKELERIAS